MWWWEQAVIELTGSRVTAAAATDSDEYGLEE